MRFPSPLDFWRPAIEAGQMLAEAQLVIGLRLAGLAGGWSLPAGEVPRMIGEKLEASTASARAVINSGLAGDSLPEMAMAGLKPLRRRTRANARRLRRKATA